MPNKVYTRSPEVRARISATLMGHPVSLETREKISTTNMGRKPSPETLVKLSISHIGNSVSPETRAKISIASKGNTYALGNHLSVESRAKISAGLWKGGKKISRRKRDAKRRQLGWNSLNSWFPDSDGHHINLTDVIYIPVAMHDSVRHNVWTGRNMDKINALAGAFLTEDWT